MYVRTSWMTQGGSKTWSASPARSPTWSLAVLLLALTGLFVDPDHRSSGRAWRSWASFRSPAVVLNLLPIPGLDGYGALEPHLSPETQRALAPAKQWGFFVLLILLIAPGLNQWFWDIVLWFFDFSGVPRGLGSERLDTDPLLVRLVLTRHLRHMRVTHNRGHGCRARPPATPTPALAGCSSPRS